MKQTAVEWLWDELMKKDLMRDVVYSNGFKISDLYEQAKQMEKQEQGEIYDHAFDYGYKFGPQELSDEEIEKAAAEHQDMEGQFEAGARWYRNQLKTKTK